MKLKHCLLAALLVATVYANAQPAKITVDAANPTHAIPPTLWGIFFEDINHSADGGIYPELVQNRSFEDADTPTNWKFECGEGKSSFSIASADYAAKPPVPPLNPMNRKSLRVSADGDFCMSNRGYWGMNIVKDDTYVLKFAARSVNFSGTLEAKLIGADGKVLASGRLARPGSKWEYQTIALKADRSDPAAQLSIKGSGAGVFYLDMVSLMPDKKWKQAGLRVDLAESIDALKPAFLRFPGGCWVEGDTMDKMYDWKKTIGDIDARTPLWNIWNYYATHGLGYHEYLLLAEDLGAEPLFCINVGMSHKEVIPMSQMGRWVQDALDAIEYANGPTNSFWGSQRAKAGHPAPFNLKYLEIGNENGGSAYAERWALMHEAIRAKYPEVRLIANHWQGGYPKSPRADIVDEHFYNTPEWFMRHANHFDNYDRSTPKVFVGEYAVTRETGLGNLRGAIGEAAFMTGLERNSDHVVMASYAPLFVNLNHRAWPVNLINFDSANWYGIPSYYVQKMFAENRGDFSLPVKVDAPLAEAAPPGGMVGVATWETAAEYKDIRVTALDGKVLYEFDPARGTQGWKLLGKGADWSVQDGSLRQTAPGEFIRALVGKRDWLDYTITLKARKISGAEGFMVMFRITGNEDRIWWNLGGWKNTASAIEAGTTLDSKPAHIETGRWYDLKLTVSGKNVKCWLDGKLMHDVEFDANTKVASLYAVAATDKASGDVILKIVNANAKALETEIALKGGAKLSGQGTATVLTSDSPKDENTIQSPTKVSLKTEPINFSGSTIKRSFPGNSFTVLRLKAK